MTKYVFSAEFDCIEDHSLLIKGMFVNTLQSLLATNGIKAIGPVELCRASDNSDEKQNDQPTGNNTSAEEPPSPQGEIKRECSTCGRKRYGTCDPSLCDTGYSGWIPA